jgi:hypothetical protein
MAFTTNYQTIPGLVAGADLSAAQFKVVKLASTAGQVILAASSILTQAFVLQNNPKSGEAAEVAYSGIVKVLAGTSNLAIGEIVGVTSTSTVIDTTTDNRLVIGKALEGSTAVGDVVSVVLIPGGARY